MELTFISVTLIIVSIFCLISAFFAFLLGCYHTRKQKQIQVAKRIENKKRLNREKTFAECLLPIEVENPVIKAMLNVFN